MPEIQPFVSVIVPVYNCEQRISRCIESLLAQDYPSDRYEVIIVDNNSTDGSAETIKGFPVAYVLEDQIQTSYAARNTGLRKARGELIAFTDDDCIAQANWLSEGITGFEDALVGCVAGEIEADDPQNNVEQFLKYRDILSQKWTLNHAFLPYPQTANAFYRKDVFEKAGGFEEQWISGGDADMAWRMQLETDYKLLFRDTSVVRHKHRSTVKSLYRQRIKWGQGGVLLYKKYKGKIARRRMKETLTDLKVFFIHLLNMLKVYTRPNKTEDGAAVDNRTKCLLDLVGFAGYKWGQLIGSIKNGVFYV